MYIYLMNWSEIEEGIRLDTILVKSKPRSCEPHVSLWPPQSMITPVNGNACNIREKNNQFIRIYFILTHGLNLESLPTPMDDDEPNQKFCRHNERTNAYINGFMGLWSMCVCVCVFVYYVLSVVHIYQSIISFINSFQHVVK